MLSYVATQNNSQITFLSITLTQVNVNDDSDWKLGKISAS